MAQGNRGAGGLNTIFMIVAFGVIAGFLYWLSITAVPAEPVAAVEEEAPQALSLAALAANPAAYQDRLVRIDGVEVVGELATDAFLVSLPDGRPYPVQLHAAIASTAQVAVGGTGSVTGRVQALPGTTVDAWAADSAFVDEAQQEAVAASGTYLVAEEVEIGAAEPAPEAAEDGA